MRVLFLSILAISCGRQSAASTARRANSDSAFAALQARGQTAMGVDQYTSRHEFAPMPDGGRIRLVRDSPDSAGARVIRDHLRDVADRFANGDFAIPAFVHAGSVPGSDEMRKHRAQLRYSVSELPGGGEIRIRGDTPDAVRAVHAFLAFQRSDHRVNH